MECLNFKSNQVFQSLKRKSVSQDPGPECKLMKETVLNKPSQREWEPVFADEYNREVETEQVFVGKIMKKQETSRLMREIGSLWPLVGKQHLKRVRQNSAQDFFEIILRPLQDCDRVPNSNHSLKDVFRDTVINLEGLSEEVSVKLVPKHPALTKKQHQDSIKLWPVKFREDKGIKKALRDEVFNEDERRCMRKYMEMAMEAAKHGEMQVGAVIVDPKSNEVVAVAHDLRHEHPMQHAVMVAVDLVAKSQGGGAWDLNSPALYYSKSIKMDEVGQKISEEGQKAVSVGSAKKALPYICTSYDLYITREPCVMCAMALVHSRIRRVFYRNAVPWGALGTRYNIHIQPGLNHHYEVWKRGSSSLEDLKYDLVPRTDIPLATDAS